MDKSIETILELAAGEGYDCEVYGEKTRNLVIEVYKGDVESLTRSVEAGAGIRLARDGRAGFAYTSDLSSTGVEKAFRNALANAVNSSALDVDILADNHEADISAAVRPGPSPERETENLIRSVVGMEAEGLGYDPEVINTEGARYFEVAQDVIVAGTRGFFRREQRGLCSCQVTAVAERGGEVRSGWYYGQALDPADLDFRSVGQEAARRAVRLLGSSRIETKRYTILVDGPAFTDITSLLAEALSAEMVVKGTSLFAGRLGDRIAPPNVTIGDDPFMKGGCFNASFDAEGVPKNKCILVESGMLAGYLHNTYSSRRMSVPPTANAVRSSFKSLPVPGPANLFLSPGTRKTTDMVAGLSEALYVQDIMGMHTADSISGDFSVGINGCYIRSGEITGSIGEMTMSGNILDMLQRIVEVGSETVFVGPYGSPAVVIEDLSVSGT